MVPIPSATKNLMLACVAVFCAGFLVPMIPWFALWPLGGGRFMPWQMLSYAFLHGSLAHLLFNMLVLWMFGSELENLWGARRYLIFLAVCAVSAAALQLLVTWAMGSLHSTVGASGAIYGLLLAYALAFPLRQFDLVGFLPMVLMTSNSQTLSLLGMLLFVALTTNRNAVPIPPIYVRAPVMVTILVIVELLFGLFVHTGIAHFAHLGGMIGAIGMVRYWRHARSWRTRR